MPPMTNMGFSRNQIWIVPVILLLQPLSQAVNYNWEVKKQIHNTICYGEQGVSKSSPYNLLLITHKRFKLIL